MISLSDYERFPLLLNQKLSIAAKDLSNGSFDGLNGLLKFFDMQPCPFSYYTPEAVKILNDATHKLKPLATRYIQALRPVKESLEATTPDVFSMKSHLSTYVMAHSKFQEMFTSECEKAAPDASFTIFHHFPEELSLYFTAFLKELPSISPSTYETWQKCAATSGEEIFEIFPRLAIHYLLEKHTLPIPKLFSGYEEKIKHLRQNYETLDASQKEQLIAKLRYESDSKEDGVQNLFIEITNLSSSLQTADQKRCNGIARIVYKEAAKAFFLLEHIQPDQTQKMAAGLRMEIGLRSIFLALLKQERLTLQMLPFDFSGDKIEKAIHNSWNDYQSLSSDEQSKFDGLFLAGEKEIQESSLYGLMRTWEKILFLWSDHKPLFKNIYLLSQIASQQRAKRDKREG